MVSLLFAYFALVLQTSDVSDGLFGVLQRLNPVSPMDDCSSGRRESVTSGRAGLTLHRWFDAIAVCASRGIDCHASKKDVYERWSSCFESGKFESTF